MPTYQFTTSIERSSDIVFETIADISNCHTWLAETASFSATTKVTPLPVRIGTTFVDGGKNGKRYGSVTEYDPPTAIAFHQPMTLPFGAAIDINIRYALASSAVGTNVLREAVLDYRMGPLSRVFERMLRPVFYRENQRVVDALKKHLERARGVR